jgi:hypothetical protein
MPQTIYTSKFFYVIRDRRNGMLYAGCKFAEDSNPNTFMTEDGYKTSSKDIQQIIDQEGLDTFEIVKLRIMDDPLDYETRFLRKVNAAANPKFYNCHNNNIASFGTESYEQMIIKKYGVPNISMNKELKLLANKKQKLTLNDPVWKETKGKEKGKKISEIKSDPKWKETVGNQAVKKANETKSDPVWKETIGKAAITKTLLNKDQVKTGQSISKTKSNPEWKETKGKECSEKQKQTKSDPVWKENVGKQANRQRIQNTDWIELGKNVSKTKSDPVWKETIGKERAKKFSEIVLSDEWKQKNNKMCEHCGKITHPANYTRWHGNKCKSKID